MSSLQRSELRSQIKEVIICHDSTPCITNLCNLLTTIIKKVLMFWSTNPMPKPFSYYQHHSMRKHLSRDIINPRICGINNHVTSLVEAKIVACKENAQCQHEVSQMHLTLGFVTYLYHFSLI